MKKASPTDEEILSYDNVPTDIAASYIGTTRDTMCRALRLKCAPYGYATPNEETETFTYNISPGGLVRYKREGLPLINLKKLEERIADAIEEIMAKRMADALKTLLLGMGKAS